MTSVLILGGGSAGRRHALTLTAAGATVVVADPDPSAAEAAGLATIPWAGLPYGDVDGVVVASPSSAHAAQAYQALRAGAKVLVEKPLATTVGEARRLAQMGGGRLAVAYNLRCFDPVVRFVDRVVAGDAGEVMSWRAWFGYSLPDWRPGVDYRTTYSAQASLGGGVLDDAIHELDLLAWLAGDLAVVGAVVARVGHLEIDVEDTVRALMTTARGVPVELSLDYLSKRYRRGLEVVGSEATLRLDWARRVLERETQDGIEADPSWSDVATSYEVQARRFVEWLVDDRPMPVSGVEGVRSVELAAAVRAAT